MRTCLVAFGISALLSWASLGAQTPMNSSAVARVRGSRTISGIIVSEKTGQPLAQANVTLRSVRAPERPLIAEQSTGPDGRFSFQDLPDDKYSIFAIHLGYVGSFYEEHPGGISTAIVTGEGLDTSGLRLSLRSMGAIYGTISDDSGDPVPNARIELFRQGGPETSGRIMRAAQTVADTEGNYEERRLAPGSYFLCVTGRPWYAARPAKMLNQEGDQQESTRAPLDVAYPLTCAPGVTDPSQAEAIAVNPGERVPVSFSMHAVPTAHITVQVQRAPDGHGFAFPQIRQEIFGISDFVQPSIGMMRPVPGEGQGRGTMQLELAAAPGQYDLEVFGQKGEPSRFATIDASGDGAVVDLSTATPVPQITGTVSMTAGEAAPPILSIRLSSDRAPLPLHTNVQSDGRFTLRDAHPGEYQVNVLSQQHSVYIQQMTVNGALAKGTTLTVGDDPLVLNLTLAPAIAELAGVVERGSQRASGVFLALVPHRRSGLPLINQSDSDGSFEFPHVAPGSYTLVAVEDGWTLDQSRRESFLPYLAKGVPVTLQVGARRVPLKDAVQVQPK